MRSGGVYSLSLSLSLCFAVTCESPRPALFCNPMHQLDRWVRLYCAFAGSWASASRRGNQLVAARVEGKMPPWAHLMLWLREICLPLSLSLSSSSSPRLKGLVRPPGHQGPPVCYGLLEGSESK